MVALCGAFTSYLMMMFKRPLSHPWGYIARELKARGRSQKNFADIIGISAPELNFIIKKKKNLTPALCVRIGAAFWTSADLRMELQTRYNLKLAKIKEEKRIERVFEKVKKYWYELLSYEDEEKYEVMEQEPQEEMKMFNTEPVYA